MTGAEPYELIHLTDIDDPRLAVYRNQRDQWRRARHRAWLEGREPDPDATGTGLDPAVDPAGDLFIAEGEKVAGQLIASEHEVVSVLLSEDRLGGAQGLFDQLAAHPRESPVPVYSVPRALVEPLVGFAIHRGVLAAGRRRPPPGLSELLARSACCVIAEELANHDNVGGMFRNVRALAPARPEHKHPACVLLGPRCCDPLYRKSLRVSMGNALHVPYRWAHPWEESLETVAAAGFTLLGLTPAGSVDIRSVEVTDSSYRPAFLLGAEGPGLTDAALAAVDRLGGVRVRIPIEPAADSINVAAACAVAMHRVCAFPG